jgi:hypothetical protein
MANTIAWRCLSIGLGITAAGLGAYGAFEHAHKLEGSVTYLVVAAPFVAAAAALIPPLAEFLWKVDQRTKALLWWLVLIPAGATVFYAAGERVHMAKAGAEAERLALHSAAQRARDELDRLRPEAAKAKAAADKTAGWSKCGNTCQATRATAARLQEELAQAEAKVLAAEKLATAEAPLKAPVWLLPVALDLVSFMGIWSGLAPFKEEAEKQPRTATKKRKRKASPRRRRKATRKVPTPANDNVVPLRAA